MKYINQSIPHEPAVDFTIPAFVHSLREHKDLRTEDIRRESLIKAEAEAKLFKNKPICQFARKMVLKSHFATVDFEKYVDKKVRRFQDRRDKRRDYDHDPADPNHTYCWASSREALRRSEKTGLHAIALANSSTEILQRRRSRNQGQEPSEEEVTERPKSMEIVQLVQHETQRRARTMSTHTNGTLEALLGASGSSTAVNGSTPDFGYDSLSPTTISSWRWSSDISTIMPKGARKSCMRYPKTSEQEAMVVAAAEAVETGVASAYVTRTASRRLSSLSQRGRRRMVSVSYPNGNQDIGSPTIEGINGVKRPRLVVFQFGEGVDEVIPGKKLRRQVFVV